MTKRNKIKQDNETEPTYKIVATSEKFTAQCSWLPFIKVLKALELKQRADDLFEVPGSNRGYRNGDILTTFLLMLNEGKGSLSNVHHLHSQSELLKQEGIKKLPGADTLSRWLRHQGKAGVGLIDQLNQEVIAKTLKLKQVTEVTLDIDATVIKTDKSSATYTYLKQLGFTMMVGTIAETGQVIAAQLRDGKVPPNYDNVGFIEACRKLLPKGIRLKCVRIDAAGYQHKVIEYLTGHHIEFVIRAAKNPSIEKQVEALPEQAWQPFRSRKSKVSQCQWVTRCTHQMYRSDQVDLVVQRTRKRKPVKSSAQQKKLRLFTDDIKYHEYYEYRMIATNIKELDNAQIAHAYNQRGEHSENRIKELKLDFMAGRPPCSDFAANALYVVVCALAFNVFALMRTGLPAAFRRNRASTLRDKLSGLTAKIVGHGRQWKLKLQDAHRRVLMRIFISLRNTIGELLAKMQYPLLN